MTFNMFFFNVVLNTFLRLELMAQLVKARVRKQKAWVRSPVMSRKTISRMNSFCRIQKTRNEKELVSL